MLGGCLAVATHTNPLLNDWRTMKEIFTHKGKESFFIRSGSYGFENEGNFTLLKGALLWKYYLWMDNITIILSWKVWIYSDLKDLCRKYKFN